RRKRVASTRVATNVLSGSSTGTIKASVVRVTPTSTRPIVQVVAQMNKRLKVVRRLTSPGGSLTTRTGRIGNNRKGGSGGRAPAQDRPDLRERPRFAGRRRKRTRIDDVRPRMSAEVDPGVGAGVVPGPEPEAADRESVSPARFDSSV